MPSINFSVAPTTLATFDNEAASPDIVLNNHSAVQVITQKNAGGTTLATVTLGVGEVAYIAKSSTDTLTGAATSLAVSVGFAN